MKNNKSNSKYFRLFLAFFLVGIILSIIYFNNMDKSKLDILINSIKESNIILKPINNITEHLKLLSLIALFSIILIGVPICFGLIVSEGFTCFFRILLLYKMYKFKGIIFAIIYYLINYLIYILFLYLIFKKVIIIFKKIYKLKFKSDTFNPNEIYNILNKTIYLIIINLIFDIIICFYGDNILKLFAFLIK